MSENTIRHSISQNRKYDITLLSIGLLLCLMELAKQLYLYFVYFDHSYDVWYFPFQLCSIPMYLCVARFFLNAEKTKPLHVRCAIDAFLQDFAMLGGIAALLIPDGFTYPDHPFLTLHGYLWHVLLILTSMIIIRHNHSCGTRLPFLGGVSVLLPLVVVAELINILLHPYGDCDMFYIAPYHPSSQPVFHDIDKLLGRPVGILIYVLAMILGAGLIHLVINNICTHKKSLSS